MRLNDGADMADIDFAYQQVANGRINIGFQRIRPLGCMLGITPARRLRLDVRLGTTPECPIQRLLVDLLLDDGLTRRYSRRHWVHAGHDLVTNLLRFFTCQGNTNTRICAQPDLAALVAHLDGATTTIWCCAPKPAT